MCWQKGKASGVSCWHGEAVNSLTRGRDYHMIGWGCVFGYLWLVLSWKQRHKLEGLSVRNQILASLGP